MHEMTAHSMQTRTGLTATAGAVFASFPAERERSRQGFMKLSSFFVKRPLNESGHGVHYSSGESERFATLWRPSKGGKLQQHVVETK